MSSQPVLCRSDSTYAERPLSFEWQGQWLAVARIVSRWREPGAIGFRVLSAAGQEFQLIYNLPADSWQVIES